MRFVYYTTADTAYRVLSNSEVWMRNTQVMNDFQEVEYGLNCTKSAMREHRERFEAAVDGAWAAMAKQVIDRFEAWIPGFRYATYITCVSEHDDSEDDHGRLSMWRAYGGENGVALVLNPHVFFTETDALAAYTYPVAYRTAQQFVSDFENWVAGLETNRDLLKSIGYNRCFALLFEALKIGVICTKHPGFAEEREWRIVYSPAQERSSVLKECIEVVRGVPQTVVKIPLVEKPDQGLTGIGVPQLLSRLIIGPTEHADVMYRMFWTVLEKAGVTNAPSVMQVSDIPLRRP